MKTIYENNFSDKTVKTSLHRLIGQVYKLLPYREEDVDWKKPLTTIQIELAGMGSLFADYKDFQDNLLILQSKLEGLNSPLSTENFEVFRGVIFDCIGRIKKIEDLCQD